MIGMNTQNEVPVMKIGQSWSTIKPTLKPFDIILFKGTGLAASCVSFLEQHTMRPADDIKMSPCTYYTHCGLVVTSEILDHPLVVPGKLYLWNSTLSGSSDYGVQNIEGQTFFGVQLQDLDEVVLAYDRPNDTQLALCRLLQNPFNEKTIEKDLLKQHFTLVFDKLNGRPYNLNFYSLLATVIPYLRSYRRDVEECLNTTTWLFCSELVAFVYKKMGIFPASTHPQNVAPMDFADYDEGMRRNIPLNIIGNPTHFTTPIHQ
jgi:hypothetical protein